MWNGISLILQYRIILILVAIGGGVFSAFWGWANSQEVFSFRKFIASVLRSGIAGVIFALTYTATIPLNDVIFYAFLGGAGFDVLGNRIGGTYGDSTFPIPAAKTPMPNSPPIRK